MEREEFIGLIERYKSDDFENVDICLIGGTDFNYDFYDNITFGIEYLTIEGSGYELRINYEDIKDIAL